MRVSHCWRNGRTRLGLALVVFWWWGLLTAVRAWPMGELFLPSSSTMTRGDFFAASASTLWLGGGPDRPRDVDVGTGGVDLLREGDTLQSAGGGSSKSKPDALFPRSMEGVWECERRVLSVEGDAFMGEACYKALGGSAKFTSSSSSSSSSSPTETFLTRFLPWDDNEGRPFCVMDRGFELASRTGQTNVVWSMETPNVLLYNNNNVQLKVVQRTVEVPSDQGFGYQEFVAIQDGLLFPRAALVKRRYRRNFDDTLSSSTDAAAGNSEGAASPGARIVEGLEIVKSYRVLDGVAGTEYPTSTVKSSIRMRRPVAS